MFTEKQKETLRKLGSDGLTIKMAQHDGYQVNEDDSSEKSILSIFGQKHFHKQASMKKIVMGIQAMEKLGKK